MRRPPQSDAQAPFFAVIESPSAAEKHLDVREKL